MRYPGKKVITYRPCELISPERWEGPQQAQLGTEFGLNDLIVSRYPLSASGHSVVGFYRRLGKPLFTPRDQTLVRLLIEHVPWLHKVSPLPQNVSEVVSLSPRECQILVHLILGCTQKEVARGLQISKHTVTDHLKGIYRQREVNSRADCGNLSYSQSGLFWRASE